ncbi:uncharacterized protein LOC142324611 isoform X7 [Lycorma delicatula]|uniref:uncharacterized protein LOC142324611 isoform X6 n=1 Tax=Lycorma delicatula TaxID=130591 RepID=UPI003F510DB2
MSLDLRCCVSLLKVENHLKDEICNKERIHNLWAKISDTVLRMLELNQCETSSFKLAEEILKFDDDFLSRLLKLYSSRVLHVTQHTLKTLVCLCQTTILQDELGSEVIGGRKKLSST